WFLSLFHEIPFLFTANLSLLTEKSYVSLNKLQAIKPHGTIALPFTISSGLQALVSFSPPGLLSCSSLRLFTYLNHRTIIVVIPSNHKKLTQLSVQPFNKKASIYVTKMKNRWKQHIKDAKQLMKNYDCDMT